VVGESGCSSETGSSAVQPLLDTDTTAAAAAADDDDDDDDDAGEDTSELEATPKVADSCAADTSDSRHEFFIAELQSATLYVSRLSQLLATLVNDATSSLDADKLLQDFSSSFCTGIAS